MSVYKIRAHHGMCLPFFRGEGYSGAFVENMTRMKKILEENPEICLGCGQRRHLRRLPQPSDGKLRRKRPAGMTGRCLGGAA